MLNPVEHLVFRAKLQPDGIALQSLSSSTNYRALLALVRKTAERLRQAGVKPGQVVLTCLPNKNVDWIVTLALFHEGAITCSNHGFSETPAELNVDFSIINKNASFNPPGQAILVDASWFESEQTGAAPEIAPQAYPSADSLCRLVLTSGTTGHRKVVPLTVRHVEDRARSYIARWSAFGSEINAMALSTYGGFNVALCNLMAGTPLYTASNPSELVTLLSQFQVGFLAGSPLQLGNFVEEIKKRSIRLTSLKAVRYGGGAASVRLIRNIQGYLCGNVIDAYSSTEAGNTAAHLSHTAMHIPGAAGYSLPDVEFQVVGPNDEPLPLGQEGTIRVKTPYMVNGYYNNPDLTEKFFKQGWFYPGDRGRIQEDGLLVLSGRESELINRGGVKIDPVALDHPICEFDGVEDAAVFGIENASGVQEVCAALVVGESFQFDALKEFLKNRFGLARSPDHFFRVDKIPRNQMGKPLRHELARKYEDLLKKGVVQK
jgi:long-chain acyl-CoA synthetase